MLRVVEFVSQRWKSRPLNKSIWYVWMWSSIHHSDTIGIYSKTRQQCAGRAIGRNIAYNYWPAQSHIQLRFISYTVNRDILACTLDKNIPEKLHQFMQWHVQIPEKLLLALSRIYRGVHPRGGDLGGLGGRSPQKKIWGGGTAHALVPPPIFWEGVLSDVRESMNRLKNGAWFSCEEMVIYNI